MSEFPQPGELETMGEAITDPYTDRVTIMTYGETFDVDGAPVPVFSEGDEIKAMWGQGTPRGETPGDRFSTAVNTWTVTIADTVAVTRRDMVKLTVRNGKRLAVPIVGNVWGDPVPMPGVWVVFVREVTQ